MARVLILVALAIVLAGTAFKAPSAQSLRDERRALVEARENSANAQQRAEALRAQADSASGEAERLRAEAAALAARIQQAEADIAAAEARIAIVNRLQEQQTIRLAERQGPLVRLMAALQKLARRPDIVTLLEPRSLEETIYLRAALEHVIPEVQARTADLRGEVDRGRQLRAQADQAALSLRQGRENLAARRQQLAALEANRRVEAGQLAYDASLEEERAMALGEEARDILDLMDRIESSGATREALAGLEGPLLRPGQGENRPADRPAGRRKLDAYQLPVDGEIVAGLGEISPSGYRARGLSIRSQPGAQVVAPAAGRVAYAGDYPGFGAIVIIEHDARWTSLVTNLQRAQVEVGDRLNRGAPLGRSNAENGEITVELRRNGRPINITALIG